MSIIGLAYLLTPQVQGLVVNQIVVDSKMSKYKVMAGYYKG